MAKKIAKWAGIVLLVIVAVFGIFLAVMTVTEYAPATAESLELSGDAGRSPSVGESVSVLTFNIGYGALGAGQDFFMDGGDMVRPDDASVVEQNMAGIVHTLGEYPSDVYFLQEVDIDSHRSYNIDEATWIAGEMDMSSAVAFNFNSAFVPYPLPPIGKVEGGLMTLSDFDVSEALRVSLPVPFQWPVRLFNLKRCLLAEWAPLENGKDLVLVNLHLEAYDDGEGREAQTRELMDLLVEEYQKGNYVIAGGDFNQIFPGEEYPLMNQGNWMPGELDEGILPEGWQFAADVSAPTCRLVNEPFNGDYAATQLYVIDGFILSPNVRLDDVRTIDLAFENSDHNPVQLQATLLAEDNN